MKSESTSTELDAVAAEVRQAAGGLARECASLRELARRLPARRATMGADEIAGRVRVEVRERIRAALPLALRDALALRALNRPRAAAGVDDAETNGEADCEELDGEGGDAGGDGPATTQLDGGVMDALVRGLREIVDSLKRQSEARGQAGQS